MAIKYLFIDIDGTLFDHGTESIPPSALLALHQAHERGHKIFLCTGRANTEIDPMYRSLPISGMILSCGAQIYAENEMIYLGQYPQDALKELVHYMESNQIGFSLDGWKRSFFSEEAFTIFAAALRLLASSLSEAIGKERSSSTFSISLPTAPLAPRIAMRYRFILSPPSG